MAFKRKILTAIFQLGNGSFPGGGNTLTLTNMRMSAQVTISGGDGQSFLNQLSIYGMSLAQMNQLALIGNIYSPSGVNKKNLVAVQAGDEGETPTTIFEGYIVQAFVDANQMPEVRFIVNAQVLNWLAKTPAHPTSKQGSADASSMVSTLASQMGLKFENNSVSKILSNPYLHGTAISQLKKLAESADFQWLIDRGTLAIWPTAGKRSGGSAVISAQTGMVGYPKFSQNVLIVTTLFNPDIKVGQEIEVKSTLAGAAGKWKVNQIVYMLDSWTPHGRWFMDITTDNSSLPESVVPSGD